MAFAVWDADGSDPWVNIEPGLDVDRVVDHYARAVPPGPVFVSCAVELPSAHVDASPSLASPCLLYQ